MKKILAIFLSCSLILQGCTGLIVSRGEKPEISEGPIIRSESPYDTSEEWIEGSVEFETDIDQTVEMDYLALKPSSKRTAAVIEAEARANNWVYFWNAHPIRVRSEQRGGKYKTGIVREPKTLFLAEMSVDPQTHVIRYKLMKAARCGNRIKGLTVVVHPARLVIRERYLDTRTVTERYRDIDYTPALWAGLGGLLVGGIIGWILHPSAGTTTILSSPKGPVPCPPGAPVPRP